MTVAQKLVLVKVLVITWQVINFLKQH